MLLGSRAPGPCETARFEQMTTSARFGVTFCERSDASASIVTHSLSRCSRTARCCNTSACRVAPHFPCQRYMFEWAMAERGRGMLPATTTAGTAGSARQGFAGKLLRLRAPAVCAPLWSCVSFALGRREKSAQAPAATSPRSTPLVAAAPFSLALDERYGEMDVLGFLLKQFGIRRVEQLGSHAHIGIDRTASWRR